MDKLKDFLKMKKMKWLIIGLFVMSLFALIGYMFILYGGKLIVDDQDFVLPATTTIETADGDLIGELYDERRYPVAIDQVPDHVQDAFVAIEDRRFYNHSGVDFKSVVRAIYRDIIARDKVEGASTITQQLAKNLFLDHDKTWMRKTKEVMAAIYLEREFSKDYILELYLNKVYFGHGMYGIESASRKFFSKSANDLTVSEGAMLAGLIKAPNHYSPIDDPDEALNRRNTVLQAMGDMQVITAEQRLQEQGKTLGIDINDWEISPWNRSYIDLVTKEAVQNHQLLMRELKRGGYRIVVNLDADAQRIAYKQFQDDAYFPGSTENVEGAFVMMNLQTGRVVSVLGGRHYELGDLNRATVKRQPGSTIKPLAVYAPAMMQDEYEPYSLLPDEKMTVDGDEFSNIDDSYSGKVSMYEAIVESKNVPAVWLLNHIGIESAKTYLEKMGLNLDDDGLSIALGGLTEGFTPLEMVKGFSAFARDGKAVEPYTIERIYDGNNDLIHEAKTTDYDVFSAQVAWNITEILQYTVKEGTAKQGNFTKALAGKTGSTEHIHVNGMVKDAWFVSYTPEYVTAVWMGYDRSDEDHYLTAGSSYPTRLTKDILTKLDETKSLAANFSKPDHVKAIPEPIELPDVKDVAVSYVFRGLPLVKGKLTWTSAGDNRVVYRVYREANGLDELVGEVTGENEFIIDDVSLFQTNYFYVVPYDPNTDMEGDPSEMVELSM